MIKRLAAALALMASAGCGGSTDTDTIVAYGRENNSGTYMYFKEHVLVNEDFAADVQTLPGTAAVINAVSKDKASIGYGGIAYAKGVRALKVKKDATSPAIEPSLDNVVSGSYPISRYLYFYTVGEPEGAVKHFISWARSAQGQKICSEVGYYPLPEKQWAGDAGAAPSGKTTITIKGSDTMVILGQRWAEHYMKSNPDISIQITGGGSGTGIAALIDGKTNICQASRPMKQKEKDQVKEKQGKAPVEFSVALDGLAVFVHESNKLQEISLPQLKSIYTGKVKKWSALAAPDPLLLAGKPRRLEALIEFCIRSSGFVVIGSVVLIFFFVGKEAVPLLTSSEVHEEVTVWKMVAPQEGGGYSWQPVSTVPKYSLLPLLIGTLKVTLVALIIALPIAVGAAIFTSEFAPQGVREVIKPAVELLAGIPSVVIGFFALMVLATWLQDAFGIRIRLNAITAGIGLALAVIPIVYTVSEDALSAVPQAFRDGSQALGANRWQTAWRVVLPAATPGVFAACVLGAGRSIGETMIVLMASGNAATMSLDPTHSFRSFSATIAAELGEVVRGDPHYRVLFFIGAALFVITFLLNLAGHAYVGRLKKKLRG